MENKVEQQSRAESRTRTVAQIRACVRSGDYARAVDFLRSATAEFPNDAELSELEKFAQNGVQRKAEADRLITESQELFEQQKSAEAIQVLRKAYELDKNNTLARAILANALVEHAQSLVETDWLAAETLTNQALALNPAHPTAKTILNQIVSKKETSPVEDWVAQARKLQSSGDLFAALAWVAEGLAVHPHDPKLLQVQDEIQRDQEARRRQARRGDLEDLRSMQREIDGAANVAAKQALAVRIQTVAAKHWTDGEVLSIANALLLRLGLVSQESSSASPRSKGATVILHVPRPTAPKPSPAETSQIAASAIVPSQVAPSQVLPTPIPARKPIPAEEASAGVVAPSKVPASPVAAVRVPAVPPVKGADAPSEPRPAVRPAAPVSTVASSVVTAKVTSSSSQPKPPARSNATTLILASAVAAIILVAATFFFTRKHYAPPAAKTASAAPATSAQAVSAPAAPSTATPAPAVSAPTVSTPTVSAPAETGPEQSPPALPVSSDTGTGNVTVEQPPPAESGRNVGTLVVVAGQDDARVLLNGKLQRQLTRGGQLRIPNLEPKDYVVQVSKSGFEDSPQQKIRIGKGEAARVVINLQPKPRLASLTIQGGVPGTTILVDQNSVGTVQADGTLSVSNVNPGDHTVELHKERFKPRQFKKHFVAGGTVSLASVEAALEAAASELKINFTPADATVAVVKGDLLKMISSGVPLNLAPGTYTLTARTAERFTRSAKLDIVAGQSKTLDLSLGPNGMSKWDNASAWKQEKDGFIRKGGDFVLYGVVPASGTFMFSAMPAKGHLLQWVINYSDSRNYVLFQMDDSTFYRTVIRNGMKTDETKVPDKGDKKSFRTIQIRVSATEIVHQVKHGDSWSVLDRWTQSGANLGLGRFGFYIPGNDQITVSSFSHYADLNIH